MSENRVIGRGGGLPWRLSADLRHFKRVTMGHHIVMGRRTYESIGRPLPGRTTVVMTQQAGYEAPGVLVAHDLDEALRLAVSDPEPFIVGGAEIYRLALPRVERLHVTLVHTQIVHGDAFFPELEASVWQSTLAERHSADSRNEFDYSFLVYERQPTVVAGDSA